MKDSNLNIDRTVRNYGLDVLKITATVIIIFHHYQQNTETLFYDGFNFYGGSWFYWGYLVELFFMISGFLMYRYVPAITEGKISLVQWYIKRTVRLLPLLAASVVVYEALLHVHASYCSECVMCFGQTINLWGSIITSLGMHAGGAFAIPWINTPTWYVGVLIILYVVFYIVTALSEKVKCPLLYAYIFMVLLGCSVITSGLLFPYFNDDIGRGYACFFLGLLLGMYVDQYGVSVKVGITALLVSASFVFLCLFHANPMMEDIRFSLIFVLYPSLILFTESGISKALFRHRFWGVWSQCSYNAYIWHNVVIFAIVIASDFANNSGYLSQRATMFAVCILIECIGIVSHFLIEKPVDRWIRKTVFKQSVENAPEKAM